MRKTILLALAALAPSCAFGARRVALGPVEGSSPARAVRSVPVAVTVSDERAPDLRPVVGHVKNGYGMKTAEVFADREPAEWVRDCLAAELRRVGFDVIEAPAAGGLHARVALEVCYAQAYWKYGAEVVANLALSRDGAALKAVRCSGTVTGGTNWAATAGSFQRVLDGAMARFLDATVCEIAAASAPGRAAP